jgi:hypothetical protein
MKKLFKKFKNIHFLWIVGVICFLTFYIPVAIFTDYVCYVPEWSLPIFVIGTMVPLWANEFFWRASKFNSSHYMMFHDLYFDNKKWVKQTANIWLILTKYGWWSFKQIKFWLATLVNVICLSYAYFNFFHEEFFAFTPFYISNAIWWLIIIGEFPKFKLLVEDGYIRYGKIKKDGTKTHFSKEWYEERERMFLIMEEQRKKIKEE